MKKKNLGFIIIIIAVSLIGIGVWILVSDNNTPISTKTKIPPAVKKKATKSDELLGLGQKLWDYAFDAYWGKENVWPRHTSDKKNAAGGKDIVCDVTVGQIKESFASDFSATSKNETYTLEEFLPSVACNGAGRGALQNYKETTLELKEATDDKIIYTATSTYCSNSFCEDRDGQPNTITEEIKKDFVIVKQENGRWVIKTFYLPN